MEHDLELISPILEIVDRTIHIQSYPGNSNAADQDKNACYAFTRKQLEATLNSLQGDGSEGVSLEIHMHYWVPHSTYLE